MTPYKKGFSLSELLIATFIAVLAIVISLEVFISLNYDYQTIAAYLTTYIKGREAIDAISKDCRIAIRVMDSFGGYTTANDCLVLKVPSIDSSHDIIDINKNFDYIIYSLNNGNLWKTVIPGTGSARQACNGIFEKSTETFSVTGNGVPLSDIPYKSVVTNVTISITVAEIFRGKAHRVTPGTGVKLMNYEWGFVR